MQMYSEGVSVPNIAKYIGIARGTLYRYLAYVEVKKPINYSNGRWKRGVY